MMPAEQHRPQGSGQDPQEDAEKTPAGSAQADKPAPASGGAPVNRETPPPPERMNPVRKWTLIFGAFCLLLLVWYLLSDRFTPFTTQARVNAFVVPISPQVAGEIVAVKVTNNQHVSKGQLLAQIDPERYELAAASAEAQVALTAQNLEAASAAVVAAAAAVDSAKANLVKHRQDEGRLRRIAEEDPGAISQRRLEMSAASFKEAEAHVQASQADLEKARAQRGPRGDQNPQLLAARSALDRAKADLEKARAQRGPRGDQNPQLLAARSALDRAKLDLRYTQLVAPADGIVTDLRVDVGNFAQTGQPLMTIIASHQLWIQADLTENSLGQVKPGDPVEAVLDVWPGEVLRGRVRTIIHGVRAAESTSTPGGLPTIQNTRDWLRDAQRFPVLIDLDNPAAAMARGMRVGGQVNVIVYTGKNPVLNALGKFLIRLSGGLSYVY